MDEFPGIETPEVAAIPPSPDDFQPTLVSETVAEAAPPAAMPPPPLPYDYSPPEPTGAFPVAQMPAPLAARSWTSRNAKVLGIASLAVILVCVVPLGYFMHTRSGPLTPRQSPPIQPLTGPASNPGGLSTPVETPQVPGEAEAVAKRPQVAAGTVKGNIARGDYYLHRGDYDKAIGAYQDALSIDPSSAEASQKLKDAVQACKKESLILNTGGKCGEQ